MAECGVGAESRWRAVPRTERCEGRGVIALVVRCRVMRLLLYSRVSKNHDTGGEPPAGAGAGRTTNHLTVLFSQKALAARSANDNTDLLGHRALYFFNKLFHNNQVFFSRSSKVSTQFVL